jgi:hypothetical protein
MRSGANFDSACNDEGRPSEPLGNSVDSKQHKDVGLVVEIFLDPADSARPVAGLVYGPCQLTKTPREQKTVRWQITTCQIRSNMQPLWKF